MNFFLLIAMWSVVFGLAAAQTTANVPTTNSSVGISKQVFSGSPAILGQFPWQASIYINKLAPAVGRHCGGSLIHPQWVLSAAHCFITPYTTVKVWFGSLTAMTGTTPLVASVIKHPLFNPTSFFSDIAVIKLTAPVALSANINIIKLVPDGLLCPLRWVKNYVSGWGKTSATSVAIAPALRYIGIAQTYNLLDCHNVVVSNAAAYGVSTGLPITHICTGATGGAGQAPCLGDDGSALVELSVTTGVVNYQVGIVSFYPLTCGSATLSMSAYTRVDTFRPWLIATTGVTV